MNKIFFIPLLFKISILAASSISEISDYPAFCLKAVNDQAVFSNFKNSSIYKSILEHVEFEQGLDYLQIVKDKYPNILNFIDKCRENDLIGNPVVFDYGSAVGEISPTTLRYMKVAGDLLALFGPMDGKKIIEIGGGYGGQCKIFSELSEFSSYTIVDLPEVSLLAQKYLNLLNVAKVDLLNNRSITSQCEYDLVISNYAFSEISADEQIDYIKFIMNRSACGYLTCNFISDLFGIKSLSLDQLLSELRIPGRNIRIFQEDPVTSSNNLILVWSSDS